MATDGADDVHDAMLVKLSMSPLANVPVAMKPDSMLSGTVGLVGETLSEESVDPSTTSPVLPVIAPKVAVMVTAPADCPVTDPEGDTAATCGSEDVHVTAPLIGRWLPSLNAPVAV